jgi:hypothetical protein
VQRLLKEKGASFVVAAGQSGSIHTAASAASAAQSRRSRAVGDIPAPIEAADMDEWRESDGPDPDSPGWPALDADGRERLEAVIAELLTAKRLLDQAR